ncbi:MAG: sugar kinase [Promethearchaeota archaeon]
MVDIVSIGECMIELYMEPRFGENIYVRGFGGDTLNTIVAAARLGSSVAYLTKIGYDPFSQFLLASWKKEKIDVSQIKKVKGAFIGLYFINLDENGERSFQYYRKGSAASTLIPEDFDIAFIREALILYSSGITQALSETNQYTVKELFRNYKAKSSHTKLIAYDPNYREQLWFDRKEKAIEAQEEVLPYIDLIFPSFPSDAKLSNSNTPEEMINFYTSKGINTVIVKLGAKGSIFTNDRGKTIQRVPAFNPSKIVDTTGAGDAFNGGVLRGFIKKFSVEKAVKFGTLISGLKIQGKGAITSLPTLTEVNRHWKG